MTLHANGGSAAISGGSPVTQRIAARAMQSLRRLVSIHRTRRELRGLSDEVLRDIGLSRCDIDFVAASTSDADER